jgi:type I restriction enzyme S subunit
MSPSLPEVPLGTICELLNGRAFKPTDWVQAGLPIVRIQNLNDPDALFNCYDGAVSDRHRINSGDILLSWSGTPGTSFGCFVWQRGPAVLNQHIFKVCVDESRIDREFFVHAVNSRLEEMIAESHGGVGLRHITKSKLEKIGIPVPEKAEQLRLVTRIRSAFDRVAEIRQLAEDAEREAAAVFPSLLAAALDGLSDPPRAALAEVVVDTRYGTSRKCDRTPGVPVLRIPNVSTGQLDLTDMKYCEMEKAEIRLLALEEGDLLVVRTNGSPDLVGRTAVFSDQGRPHAFASYLIRIRVNQTRLNPWFLSYFLESTYGRDAIAACRKTSAGQFNVNSTNLLKIEVPLPPLEAQRDLVETMSHQRRMAGEIRDTFALRLRQLPALRAAVLRGTLREAI